MLHIAAVSLGPEQSPQVRPLGTSTDTADALHGGYPAWWLESGAASALLWRWYAWPTRAVTYPSDRSGYELVVLRE